MAYDANSIQIRDFRTAARATPGMYIGAEGQEGIFNCFMEVLNNACDEAMMGRGNKIVVDLADDSVSITDEGAGCPHGKNKDSDEVLVELFTQAHTSGKFQSENYKRVRGCHGVGCSAVCVCSTTFQVWTRRDGYEWFMEFKEGIPQFSVAKKGKKIETTGSTFKFYPDNKVFKVEEGQPLFVYQKIREELQLTSYFIPNVSFILNYNGETETFLSKNGLRDFAEHQIRKPLHKEYIYGKKSFPNDVDIEVFAQWTNDKEKSFVFSNGALNPGGGTPISGAKTAFSRTVNSLAKKDFDSDMVRKGLVYIINIRLPNPVYQNQIKDKIQNTELKGYTQTVFTDAIKEFARKNPDEFEKIVDVLDKEKRADEAAERAREAILSHEKDMAEASKKKFGAPIKLMDCEKHGENSILFITEGKSAKTPVQNARNIENEAVYDIRGKIIGALKNPIDRVLENEEVKDIIQILGCGIFEKYDEKKLNYGKLIIFSDRDADGSSISNLIVSLLYVLMPDFIKQGRLGRIMPPLYRLRKGKKRVYFYSKVEYEKEKKKYPGWDATYYKGIGECDSEDMKLTMFSPTERRIEMYKVDDFSTFSAELNLLMGEDVPARRDYIFKNIDFHKLQGEVE